MQAYFMIPEWEFHPCKSLGTVQSPKQLHCPRSASTKDAEFSKMTLCADTNKFAVENMC